MAEIECACYLFAFLFTGYAIICADPQTRFPDEGEPDLWYEGQLRQVYNMHLLPHRDDPPMVVPDIHKQRMEDMFNLHGEYFKAKMVEGAVKGGAYLSITDPDFAAKWMDQSLGFGIKCFNAPHTEFEDGNGY